MPKTAVLRQSKPSQSISQIGEIRQCDYCGRAFTVNAQSSRQIYHDPEKERRLAMLRKKALIEAVCQLLWSHQCHARDMRAVAAACVNAEPKAIMLAMQALGFKYSNRKRIWQRG